MNIRKLSEKIKKYAKFDQRKALSVLEVWGRGNFDEIMDYEYPNVKEFYLSTLDYVPSRNHKKYKEYLEVVFNEKISSISEVLFKNQIFEYELEIPIYIELYAQGNTKLDTKDYLKNLENYFDTLSIIQEVEDIMNQSKDQPASDESLDDKNELPESGELNFDEAFEEWLFKNKLNRKKWLERDMKVDIDLKDFEKKHEVIQNLTKNFDDIKLEKFDNKNIISIKVTGTTPKGVIITVVSDQKFDRLNLGDIMDNIEIQVNKKFSEQKGFEINEDIKYNSWLDENLGINLLKEKPVQVKRSL